MRILHQHTVLPYYPVVRFIAFLKWLLYFPLYSRLSDVEPTPDYYPAAAGSADMYSLARKYDSTIRQRPG